MRLRPVGPARLRRLLVLGVEELSQDEVHRAADPRDGGDSGVLERRPLRGGDGGDERHVRVLPPEEAALLEARVACGRGRGGRPGRARSEARETAGVGWGGAR